MNLPDSYKADPCAVLSLPYWKHKQLEIPPNMLILHENAFREGSFPGYTDEPYFRLRHSLETIPTVAPEGIRIKTAKQTDIPLLADVINRSYCDLSVTEEQLIRYTQTQVYAPDLWILAVDTATSCIAGCGIADFDKELREGILEWIQVLPAYRGQTIGQLIVIELLKRLKPVADFVTVSGKLRNSTNPERLYRRCGFAGNDVWHILTEKK